MLNLARHIPGTFFLVTSIDPTRTITIRQRFVAGMRSRFGLLMADIKEAVVDLDVLGIGVVNRVVANANSGLSPKQFNFPQSDKKIEAFVKWMLTKANEYILSGGTKGIMSTGGISGNATDARSSWIKTHIDSAYQQGIRRGRQELRKLGVEIDEGQLGGDPIRVAFNSPVHADRVGMIYTRAYSSLKGITEEMGSVVSDVLALGIADGRGPKEIARLLNKTILGSGTGVDLGILDSLGRKVPSLRRAEVLARTEVIRAHHSANIAEYKSAGMMGIKIQAEHLTAGDERVCPKCAPLNGKRYDIDEAEYMIPVHPQCRCVAIPYIPEDEPVLGKTLFVHEGKEYSENLLRQKWIDSNHIKPTSFVEAINLDQPRKEKLVDIIIDVDGKGESEIKNIALNKLYTYQSTVEKEIASDIARNFDLKKYEGSKDDFPTVFKLPDGTYLLKDGNHRVNAALSIGIKSLKFRFYDLLKRSLKEK